MAIALTIFTFTAFLYHEPHLTHCEIKAQKPTVTCSMSQKHPPSKKLLLANTSDILLEARRSCQLPEEKERCIQKPGATKSKHTARHWLNKDLNSRGTGELGYPGWNLV